MKSMLKLPSLIIVLIAAMGLSMVGCDQPTNGATAAVDRTALGSAISAAQTLLAGTEESANGAGVAITAYWATAAAHTAFANAIAAAQGAHGNAAATQQMIDTAVSNLATARATFTAARRLGVGTQTPPAVDRTVLGNAISAAQILLAETEVSANGSDVAITAHWATAAAHTAFTDAIATARGVHDDAAATQTAIDTTIEALAAAQAVFMSARRLGSSETAVDRTALGSAIATANVLLAATELSENGSGIISGYWAPQAAITAFAEAVATAQSVRDNASATQQMVDTAISNLTTAQAAFSTARQPGAYMPATVDRTTLGSAISAAQVLLAETEVSANGSDVAITAHWATAAAHTAFTDAVATAWGVHDDATATQTAIDTAIEALTAAQAVFMSARQLGSSETAADRTALGNAIATANALLAATVPSENGSGIISGYWAPQAAITAFAEAVATAIGIRDNANATQQMVDTAVSNLTGAQAAFTEARQPGTYTPATVDRAALGNAIFAAQTLLAETAESVDGTDVSTDEFWATAAARAAFGTAITTAQGVYGNAGTGQDAVNAAEAALASARTAFNTAKQPGTYTLATVDRAALGNAISVAQILLAETVESADGTDVPTDEFWATAAARAAFGTAITTAQGVHGNASAGQGTVDAAEAALASAKVAFNTVRQPGTYKGSLPAEFIGRWYQGTSVPAPFRYEFAADGSIIAPESLLGHSISVSENTITVYNAAGAVAGTANFVLSGNQLTLSNTGASGLVPGVHTRRDITHTVTVNDSANTANINFVFSSPVAGLRPSEITVTDGTGSLETGILTGGGTEWSLAVAVVSAGNVTVSINRPGIEITTRAVAVHPITWIATVDNVLSTTAINLVFGAPVSGLTAAHIGVAGGTGSLAHRGVLTGEGTTWSLAVTVANAGNIWVWVEKTGIEAGTEMMAIGNKPREDFAISFADFRDKAPDIPSIGPTIRIVGSQKETTARITVTNPWQYDVDSIRWFFRGTPITGDMVYGSYGETLILGPRIHGNLVGLGTHFLTVEVSVNDIPYSRRIAFTVMR